MDMLLGIPDGEKIIISLSEAYLLVLLNIYVTGDASYPVFCVMISETVLGGASKRRVPRLGRLFGDAKAPTTMGAFPNHYFFFPRSFCEPFSATASWLMAVTTEPVAMQ